MEKTNKITHDLTDYLVRNKVGILNVKGHLSFVKIKKQNWFQKLLNL